MKVAIVLIILMQAAMGFPEGFVYISDLDPTIQISLRYSTRINFVNEVIAGYKRNVGICTREAASALLAVQNQLRKIGYSLVIYDAYRPQQAVDQFIAWAQKPQDYTTKDLFYPFINKSDIIPQGYVAVKSGHSRGSTIDLTIILRNQQIHPIVQRQIQLKNGQQITYMDDGSEFMGGSFDFFGELSHHNCGLISQQISQKRDWLRSLMQKHNFRAYEKQWWHYTLINERFPETYFDFDVI